MTSNLHDSYAADYDAQVRACDCHIADLMFGLCYEFAQADQRLLDVGTGSGLAAQPFARAGLQVYGMDFSQAMLDICRSKGFFTDLQQCDLNQPSWPYPDSSFEHLTACGVFHFIPELEGVFAQVQRLLKPGGVFAFTTLAPGVELHDQPYRQHLTGNFEIFSHSPKYIETLLEGSALTRLKIQKCFVGEEIFTIWVARK